MTRSAQTPCSRCGAPTRIERLHGADVVACATCGAVTLSRGDLDALVRPGDAASPAPLQRAVPHNLTLIPDDFDGPPPLTASEPPPPPRAVFHQPPQPMGKSNPTYEEYALPGEVADALPPLPPPLPKDADFDELAPETDEVPTVALSEPDFTPDHEDDAPTSLLPGHRVLPPTPALGLAMLSTDEPFGGSDYIEEDEDVLAYSQAKSRRNLILISMVVVLGVGIVTPLVGYVGYRFATRPSPEVATLAQVLADKDTDPASAEPATEPQAPDVQAATADATEAPNPSAPEPVAAPKEAPKVEPKASPKAEPAAAPKASSPARLIDAGWGAVGSDAAKAAGLFRQAMDASPGNAEASYGYGYALLQEGRASEALPHLCRALSTGSVDVQREVNGLLSRNALNCG